MISSDIPTLLPIWRCIKISWDDLYQEELKAKDAKFSKTKFNGFAVIRIGRKYKDISGVRGFEMHMERKEDTPNAKTELRDKNKILIGSSQILKDSKEYLKDVFVRKNSVVGREILVTASRNFFVGISQTDMDKWIAENLKFLQNEYGECMRYATIHYDEQVPHIHALIIPKLWNERYKKWTLQNYKFFDGKAKFFQLQDDYSKAMKGFNLSRGIKFSKAKHVEIRHFYSLINEKINVQDLESILAHSKNSKLLEAKLAAVEKTLETYRNYYGKSEIEKQKTIELNKDILTEFRQLSKEKEVYEEVVDSIAYSHHMSKNSVKQVFEMVRNNSKELEK